MSERRGTKGLELWCKKMTEGYPGVKVENMTTSWRDGMAFCAIIHHFRPDLIDFSKLNKDDIYHNNELAFRIAQDYLGIPALLEPEDMVEYEIPDRLSILTYLSQFYQAFAVPQGASNRIPVKRPQTSPEHDIGSPTSSSPPTKVAAVSVGRVRRDPCAKCRLPVFIAERFNIGKLLYHRTCFRCARCNSQLTLASYYETENGEFCCEVCPDEEKLMAKSSQEKVVLQKSLSDEEKTANLKMITGPSDDYSELFETALENVGSVEKVASEFSDARSSFFLSQIGADEPLKEDKPPLLPKTGPPELEQIDRPSKEIFIDGARNDSGFPSVKLPEPYSDKVSVDNIPNSTLESSHNIVTKDKQTDDGGGDISLVKARARLFENNMDNVSKSDVNRNSKLVDKVPKTPIKTTIPIVKLDELENFDTFSKRTYDNDTDDKKIITISTKNTTIDNISNKLKADAQLDNKEDEVDVLKKSDDNKTIEEPDIVVSHKIKEVDLSTPEASEPNVNTQTNEDAIIDLTNTSANSSPAKDVIDLTNVSSTSNLSQPPVIEISDTTCEQDVIVINDSTVSNKDTVKSETDEVYPDVLNPFDDDEEVKTKPHNESLNPFGSDEEDEDEVPLTPVKPMPTPRQLKKIYPFTADTHIPGTPLRVERVSVNPFDSEEEDRADTHAPVPAARKKKVAAHKVSLNPFWSEDEDNEDANPSQPVPKPRSSIGGTPETKQREYNSLGWSTARHNFGSTSSISSGSAPGSARKKKPAPRPPIPHFKNEFGPSSLNFSPTSSVTHSPRLTPKYRKNRLAPLPPVLKTSTPILDSGIEPNSTESLSSLTTDSGSKSMDRSDLNYGSIETDVEKDKIVKDEENRNIQSYDNSFQSPTSSENPSNLPNKSTFGQWKRRKGQAPKRPIPQRRVIRALPMSEIRRELDIIEMQQQGLEKQGVKIEQIIREKCEGKPETTTDSPVDDTPIDVEDLILQLFEIVNEKNELFRKQTELMYLKRQQRLEEEHADVEYQIRCLIMKPEENKTDSDKAREEELIKRLVEIVERRNEIIECLENDRVRETEEDNSINNHITLYTLKRDGDKSETEKSSIEKKKDKKDKHHKKEKSKHKNKKKVDSDKDVDESENAEMKEKKKKKKFNLF